MLSVFCVGRLIPRQKFIEESLLLLCLFFHDPLSCIRIFVFSLFIAISSLPFVHESKRKTALKGKAKLKVCL